MEPIFKVDELEGRGRFSGVIISAEIGPGKQFDPDREPREQLNLIIRPTSYEGKDRKTFYPISKKRESRWGAFVEALNKLGVVPQNTQELVKKEFVWEMQDISVGYDRSTGTERIVRDVLLPVEYLGTRDDIDEASEGYENEYPEIEEEDMTEVTEKETAKDEDLSKKLQQVLEKEGAMTKKEIANSLGISLVKATKLVAKLKADGTVTVEDGVVTLS